MRSQQARAEAARTNVVLQRRNRFPDITVGVGAMQYGNGIESTELMLEVEIPFQQRARRERERESRLLEEAALARMDATLRAVEERGASAWAQWTSARERRELIENTLLPQADANFRSALASYQVGEVDFGTLLEALDAWQGAEARAPTSRCPAPRSPWSRATCAASCAPARSPRPPWPT